ncbi:hypothetical protein [Massilia soli]|uniref:Uncharacterized protein n=1 Tax=Massilia soli TaxID=2792854 RepID=A0ABS7SSC0_9BURK|nr:hypothetical protein [Massilia soli]MBZ2208853.1 hypothetical protein [Massilia soli]
MSAVLSDFGLIWRHAVAPKMLRKIVWAICALLAIAGAILAYSAGGATPPPRRTLLLILPWFMLGTLYWLDLVAGAVRQVTPANARLVPRLRLRAMQLVGLVWGMFIVLIALALADGFGHPALWVAASAAWLLGGAMVRVGLQRGILLMMVSFMVLLLPRPAMLTLQEVAATPAGSAACAAWLVLLAWFGKRSLFPRGDRHFDQRAAVDKGACQVQGPYIANARSSLYIMDLDRVSRQRGSAGELVLHALGPGAHWSVSAHMLVLLAAILIAGRLLIEATGYDSRAVAPFAGGFIIMPLLLTFAAIPQRIAGRAAASLGEQSLLRLAPAAPRTGQFNRAIGVSLLRRALGEWAIVTVALVAVVGAVNAHPDLALLQFSVCFLAMPLMTVVMRDYARQPALGTWFIYLAAIYLVAMAGTAYFAMLRTSIVPVTVVCVAFGIGATACLAASRQRKMIEAPVAFPAGRLAA